ncbi:MAG: diaminopimelate epimerase [Phycisphaerae bacterium]|nr:diaminopimelate epimerase [Phycisphaerae bacterium]
MRFTKMHGIGNDYVYVNCFEEQVPYPENLAIAVSDRNFAIGSDGLILICPSETADVRMRMFNSDGSESQMCGNGVRCVAKYSYDHGLAKGTELENPTIKRLLKDACPDEDELKQIKVETGRGVLAIGLAIKDGKVQQACVDMGPPILTPGLIPVNTPGKTAIDYPISIEAYNLKMTCVSMGNPHAVFFCLDVEAIDLEHLGPLIEKHAIFPQRINVHFVQIVDGGEVIMRTWERGTGITLACGTGASAVCVAGVLASQSNNQILAHLPGGDLVLYWDQEADTVFMCGSATEVFTGEWPDEK